MLSISEVSLVLHYFIFLLFLDINLLLPSPESKSSSLSICITAFKASSELEVTTAANRDDSDTGLVILPFGVCVCS